MATRRASVGHFDLAARPGAGLLNRPTRSLVLRPSRLEPVEDVLRARRRPQGEELVIRIGEGPTAADRHEARVSDLREDHDWHSCCLHPPNTLRRRTRGQAGPQAQAADPVVARQARRLRGSDRTVTAPILLRRKWPTPAP